MLALPSLRHLPLFLLCLIASFPSHITAEPSADQVPRIKINQSFLKPDTKVPSNPVQHVLEHTPKDENWAGDCHLSGPIETTLCDYETVESATEILHERLEPLVKTPFFKYYKIDLTRECPFWQDEGLCMYRACGVDTLDESEVPEPWRAEALSALQAPSSEESHTYPGCYYRDSDYCFLDDDSSADAQYVDLTLNPETFTGYAGDSAWRVWSSIYEENCFGQQEQALPNADEAPDLGASVVDLGMGKRAQLEEDGECLEKRMYYRIVSGLHASISTHICYDYFDQTAGEWGHNLPCFVRRIASHPERLQNIYFDTVLLLRALTRIGPYLSAYDIQTGDVEADAQSRRLLDSIVDVAKRVGRFDERGVFKGENANVLKEEFKLHFRNVSLIMDCIGCDKCRLWGKIQTSGIGTALKILFELDERALNPKLNPNLLQRSEVVALINTLNRFVESLHYTEEFRRLWAASEGQGRVLREVGDGDEIVPMQREQKPDLRSAAEKFRRPTAVPSAPSQSVRPDAEDSSLGSPASVYDRFMELLHECSTRSVSACADFLKLVLELAGKVASVFGGSGKESGPPMPDREL